MDATQIPELNPHITEFYSEQYDEADRLSVNAFGRLERERTQQLLSRELPPAPARCKPRTPQSTRSCCSARSTTWWIRTTGPAPCGRRTGWYVPAG